MIKAITFILLLVVSLSAFKPGAKNEEINIEVNENFPYHILSTDKRYELPQKLHDTGGLAAVINPITACIADEMGTIFLFNLNTDNFDTKVNFFGTGYFEDQTVIADTINTLDSKGVIWSTKTFTQRPIIISILLNIEHPFELNGTCHRGDTLFVTAKYYRSKKRNSPLIVVPDIIKQPNSISVPFQISAFLFDEIDKEWVSIRTDIKAIIRYQYSGMVLYTELLSAQEFIQPEGIFFTSSENLLISNEGRYDTTSILMFITKQFWQ
jgi:hypothetical protein